MKRIILFFTFAFSITFGASAMSLKEAFDAISNVSDISVKTDFSVPYSITNGQVALAKGLDKSQIFKSGNAVYTILNQVPLVQMINGGNNNNVAAFVYASPESSAGIYKVLIVLMSGKAGDITAIYGDIDSDMRNALQNAPLIMDRDTISIQASIPDGDTYNIQVK